MESIEQLPEFDKPAYFGLPENIDRSSQRMNSSAVITQLRVLKRPDAKSAKFDKDVWAHELGPLLNLWKKLNQVGHRGWVDDFTAAEAFSCLLMYRSFVYIIHRELFLVFLFCVKYRLCNFTKTNSIVASLMFQRAQLTTVINCS